MISVFRTIGERCVWQPAATMACLALVLLCPRVGSAGPSSTPAATEAEARIRFVSLPDVEWPKLYMDAGEGKQLISEPGTRRSRAFTVPEGASVTLLTTDESARADEDEAAWKILGSFQLPPDLEEGLVLLLPPRSDMPAIRTHLIDDSAEAFPIHSVFALNHGSSSLGVRVGGLKKDLKPNETAMFEPVDSAPKRVLFQVSTKASRESAHPPVSRYFVMRRGSRVLLLLDGSALFRIYESDERGDDPTAASGLQLIVDKPTPDFDS